MIVLFIFSCFYLKKKKKKRKKNNKIFYDILNEYIFINLFNFLLKDSIFLYIYIYICWILLIIFIILL